MPPTETVRRFKIVGSRMAQKKKKWQKSKLGVLILNHTRSANVSIKTGVADYDSENVKESYDINNNILINIKTLFMIR